MRSRAGLFAVCVLAVLAMSRPGVAVEIIAYDNLNTAPTAGFSRANASTPVFGDSLNLAQAGTLARLSVSLFNSTSGGNTGSIMTGDMEVKFFDNTTPYGGGPISQPLLAAVTFGWDFTADGGLPAGFYTVGTINLTPLNVALPQNILITQQFTQTGGTSTRHGIILFSNADVGSSPNTIYLKSNTDAEGLYSLTGNPGQVGYAVTLVPEPGTMLLAGAGAVFAMFSRRRR